MDSQDIGADRKRDLIEVLVLLFFVVPSMLISFLALGSAASSFPILAFSVIFRDLALMSLVVFFLWRNGEPLTRIGLKFESLKNEAALGAGIFLPVLIVVSLILKALQSLGLATQMSHLPKYLIAIGPWEILLACILVIIVAITEETIFRGYLMLRFNDLSRSVPASVIISSAIFSLGHGYEGPANVITIGILGIILALIYVWRKSLIAPMVIHLLIDFYPLILMPLIGVE